MMASGWTDRESEALIQLWSADQVQSKLTRVVKNKCIYDGIAREMEALGYKKTGDQCRTKIKNLIARYRKVRDANRKSGNGADTSFPYFDALDGVLGTRAASEPPVILDSGTQAASEPPVILDSGSTEQTESEWDESIFTPHSPIASPIASAPTGSVPVATAGTSSAMARKRPQDAQKRKQPKRRKNSEPSVLDSIREIEKNTLKTQEENSDKHLELVMKMMAESRAADRRHERQMMSMMAGFMQNLTYTNQPPYHGQPPYPQPPYLQPPYPQPLSDDDSQPPPEEQEPHSP